MWFGIHSSGRDFSFYDWAPVNCCFFCVVWLCCEMYGGLGPE